MLNTLTNPIFWQGFAAALAFLAVSVGLIALAGRAIDDLPHRNYRAGDRKPWPGRSANDDSIHSRRSEMRGGPR